MRPKEQELSERDVYSTMCKKYVGKGGELHRTPLLLLQMKRSN